jgi:energy-coupling factor transport system permease protein
VFLSFAVFSGAVSPVRLLRLAPASLFHASLIVTVGLTLLPSIVQDTRRIREMQLLRGASGRLRHLPGLVVPAILGGLDRSLRLAEALEARGYAAAPPQPVAGRLAGMVATPCFLAAAWFWFYTDSLEPLALPFAFVGTAAVAYWFRASTRVRHTTRLHEDPVPVPQALLAGLTFVLAVALPFLRAQEAVGFAYNPFAGLPVPPFAPLPAAIALLAAWPAAFLLFSGHEPQRAESPAALTRDEALLR